MVSTVARNRVAMLNQHLAPQATRSANRRRGPVQQGQRRVQARQLLSCTKCRERKVKCDRTQPCGACCARGRPRECVFVVDDGNDFTAISQSYEIRRLRTENQQLLAENERLKEQPRCARCSISERDDSVDPADTASSSKGSRRASLARQKRFKTGDRADNLYFGTPGLANMVSDFASMQLGGQSLAHPMPRLAPQEMYAPRPSIYPFHILWSPRSDLDSLTSLLPDRDEIMSCLDLFQRRAQSCSFPHAPDEATRTEVERFLLDLQCNADCCPDMLALVFMLVATGLQMGQYDASGGKWEAGAAGRAAEKADVFLAASMQALRLGSFLSQPTLLTIQTLIMMGPYLTNSGHFLDAFSLFGLTIRSAHSIGLHRNPKCLNPTPPLRECKVRQSLWWWMLHMDQQYSVTLGRPLGISGFGDCPPPEPLTTNPTLLRLEEFIHHFTILARQILSSDGMMSVNKIDEYTDKLLGLWDTMPESLQFCESWIQVETPLPNWPLEITSATLFASVQSYLILLNRQRIDRVHHTTTTATTTVLNENVFMQPIPVPPHAHRGFESFPHPVPLRGRALVINSSIHLIQTFMFCYYRDPAVLTSWTIGQQAFNACMIIILDAWETGDGQNEWLVNQALMVFSELDAHGVHQMAGLALRRISEGLLHLAYRREQNNLSPSHAQYVSSGFHLEGMGLPDWGNDMVMGNTGMFLIEDPGLQEFAPVAFTPLSWTMAPSIAVPDPAQKYPPRCNMPHVGAPTVQAMPFPEGAPPPMTSFPVNSTSMNNILAPQHIAVSTGASASASASSSCPTVPTFQQDSPRMQQGPDHQRAAAQSRSQSTQTDHAGQNYMPDATVHYHLEVKTAIPLTQASSSRISETSTSHNHFRPQPLAPKRKTRIDKTPIRSSHQPFDVREAFRQQVTVDAVRSSWR